jgi:hypothetical protein
MASSTLKVVWKELWLVAGWLRTWQFQPPSSSWASSTRPAQWLEPRIAVAEVRTEPEPESEVAEIDPLEQEGAVDLFAEGHEPAEEALDGHNAAG